MTGVQLLGWLAVLLTFVRLASQPWHNLRSGQLDGVSVAALGNNLVSDIFWVWFGLEAGLAPVWIVAVLVLPIDVLSVAVVRARVDRWSVLSATAWALALGGAWWVAGVGGLGALLVASVAVIMVPQIVAVIRRPRLTGLSLVTVGLSLADAAVWGAYGAAAGDATVMFYGIVLAVGAAVIGWRVVLTRMSDAGGPAGDEVAAYTSPL